VAIAVAYDPADQKRRRRRARVTIADLAARLDISVGALSQYENGKTSLPFELNAEDYERALLDAITAKRNEGGNR
jgi:transcriptional regulator with XRE-family HTH domain